MPAAPKPTLAIASPSFAKAATLRAEARELNVDLRWNDSGRVLAGSELATFLEGASLAIIGREIIDGELLNRCPELALIAKYGVGLDNIDATALATHGVTLAVRPGVNRLAVAEMVVGFIINHFRNLALANAQLKSGSWNKNGGRQISELTVGIVGFGHVGNELAKVLVPLGSRTLCCDIEDRSAVARDLGCLQTSYDRILREADVISFHVPLTPATQRMLGEKELRAVKPSVLVINTARGEVVDFLAGIEAIRLGRIGGLAVDVFDTEPCDLRSLKDLSNVYLTPHTGGNSQAAVLAMGRAALDAVAKFLTDRQRC